MLVAVSAGSDLLRGLLQGTPAGAVYALIALGFVLAYKTSGVFNLAFGAQAYVSAAFYFQARNEWGWGTAPAVIVSVFVLAPAIGLVLERLVFRHIRTGSSVAKLVITIGLSVAIPAIYGIVFDFTAVAGRTPVGIVPDGSTVFYDVLGTYSFSRDELVAMAAGIIATAVLYVVFEKTAIGLQMRAVVESPRMTELNGVKADRVSAFSWALSSAFAGLAGVLIAPRFNTLSSTDFFYLVVVAIAAAAVGRLVSLPGALLGGLSLGWLIALANTFLPRISEGHEWLTSIQENVTPAMPFIVLFALLVFWPAIRSAKDHADPLSGVDPPPLSLAATERSPGLTRGTRIFAVCFFALTGWVVFTKADASWMFMITQAVILATIFLSIVVITGMAGQISLCQGAFAAIGGFTVFQLATQRGMSVLLATVIGAAIAAAVGALLAIPIRRLDGVWVAIATLAFACFFDAVMVKLPWVGGGNTSILQGTVVPRPTIGPWDLADDKKFLALCLVVFAVAGIVVIQLRSGTTGQSLRAIRGSEVASQSIGISPGQARILAFAVSAFLAGLGGGLLSMQQQNVNYPANFGPVVALFWMVLVVSLGCRTVEGAAQAAAAFALFDAIILKGAAFGWILRDPESIPGLFPISDQWRFILFGLGTIQFARHPEGMVEAGKRRAHHRTERAMAKLRHEDPAATADEPAAPEPSVEEPVG